jgi:hypothetical protein
MDVTSLTPIWRIASNMFWPCETGAAPSLRVPGDGGRRAQCCELGSYTTARAKYFLRVERSLLPK